MASHDRTLPIDAPTGRSARAIRALGSLTELLLVALAILMQLFAVKLGWFPVSGYGGPGASFGERLYHLALPAVATAAPAAKVPDEPEQVVESRRRTIAATVIALALFGWLTRRWP